VSSGSCAEDSSRAVDPDFFNKGIVEKWLEIRPTNDFVQYGLTEGRSILNARQNACFNSLLITAQNLVHEILDL
jgi:hypothetical protein